MEVMLTIVVVSLVSAILWLGRRLWRRQAELQPELEPDHRTTITIADPRTNPVPDPNESFAQWVVEGAVKQNALHIYIYGVRPHRNIDLLDQLLVACPSDYLLFWGDSVGTWKKIRERRSRQPLPKGGYREILAHTPENRTAMVDLLRDLQSLGMWTYCTFPEKNRAAVESYAENHKGWILEPLNDHLDLFDLTVRFNMDPPVEIEIWATRPDQYDRIIEIVNTYNFLPK